MARCHDESSCKSEQTDSNSNNNNNCCCCHYDPFDDDSPESRIKDLSFALKKLSVMKCQMKKWRIERLELESQVIAMTKSLMVNGVDVDRVLKVDPLVAHLRIENQKLENRKSMLEDEVRDLRETLKERECCENQPCKEVIYAREKILQIRARSAAEKRRLQETMGDLQLKLNETTARLTNEIDQRQHQVSKKSMGELCNQLKKENKRLLAEIESLKNCLKSRDPKTAEICERVRASESQVNQLKLQLIESDAMLQDLDMRLINQRRNATQLEKVAVSQLALGEENIAIKVKQKQKDEKHSLQLDAMKVELEKARASNGYLEQTLGKLGNENTQLREAKTRLESELKELQQRLQQVTDEVQCAKESDCRMKAQLDHLQNEVKKSQNDYKKISNERNELANQICTIKDQLSKEAKLLKNRLDDCLCELDETRRNLEESKAAYESANACSFKFQYSLDVCTSDKNKLTDELEQTKAELCKQLDDTERLRGQLKAAQRELDRLNTVNAAISAENSCLKKDNESLKKSVETSEKAKETLAVDLVNAKIEMQSEKQRLAVEVRRQSTDSENELKRCHSEIQRLKRAINENKRKAQDEMVSVTKALKMEMQAQIEAIKRTTDFMNYAEGKVTRQPNTSTRIAGISRTEKWSTHEINELFDSSRILSESISKAQEVAKNLEIKTTNESTTIAQEAPGDKIELKETGTCMEITTRAQHVTKPNGILQVFPRAISPCMLSPKKPLLDREHIAPFDPTSWLKSLSLTQLAELHEQICATTASIVSSNGATLQRKIAKRQREVTVRATQTQLALLKEQTRLAKIAEAMNREANFELHISVDARMASSTTLSDNCRPATLCCCTRKKEECSRLGCTVDFDPNRQLCRK